MKRRCTPVCAFGLSSGSLWCVFLYSRSLQRRAAAPVALFELARQHLCFSGGRERLTPKVSSWVTNEFIFIGGSKAVSRLAKIIYPFLKLRYINSSQFAVKIIISCYYIWHFLAFPSATVHTPLLSNTSFILEFYKHAGRQSPASLSLLNLRETRQ